MVWTASSWSWRAFAAHRSMRPPRHDVVGVGTEADRTSSGGCRRGVAAGADEGPRAATRRPGRAPPSAIYRTGRRATPSEEPRQPACAMPMGPASSARNTGTQSAATMPSSTPRRSVRAHRPRAGGNPARPAVRLPCRGPASPSRLPRSRQAGQRRCGCVVAARAASSASPMLPKARVVKPAASPRRSRSGERSTPSSRMEEALVGSVALGIVMMTTRYPIARSGSEREGREHKGRSDA